VQDQRGQVHRPAPPLYGLRIDDQNDVIILPPRREIEGLWLHRVGGLGTREKIELVRVFRNDGRDFHRWQSDVSRPDRTRSLWFVDPRYNLAEQRNGRKRAFHERGMELTPGDDGIPGRPGIRATPVILALKSYFRFAKPLANLSKKRNRRKGGIHEGGVEFSPGYGRTLAGWEYFRNRVLRFPQPLPNLSEKRDRGQRGIHKGNVELRLGCRGARGRHRFGPELLVLGFDNCHKTNSRLKIRTWCAVLLGILQFAVSGAYIEVNVCATLPGQHTRKLGGSLHLSALAYRPAQARVHLACMFFDALHDAFG